MNKFIHPKITVTMPAYNASKFIKEAIESVLAQDHDSFELVILDDGSTDNTWEIIRRYKKDPRVRAFRNRKNTGGGAARNRTIRLARGKYVSFCDADDLMMPGNLKTLSRFLDAHPKTGMVYPKTLVITIDAKSRMLETPFVTGQDFSKGWDLLGNLVCQGGAMARKRLLLKAGGYDETAYCSSVDYGLWLRLCEITKVEYLDGGIFYAIIKCPKRLPPEGEAKYRCYKLRKLAETIKRRYDYDFKA